MPDFQPGRLVYKSSIDQTRVVRCRVLEVEKMEMYDVLMKIWNEASETARPARRYRWIHFDRRTGDVYWFRPQAEREEIGFGSSTHKIRVGVQGRFL